MTGRELPLSKRAPQPGPAATVVTFCAPAPICSGKYPQQGRGWVCVPAYPFVAATPLSPLCPPARHLSMHPTPTGPAGLENSTPLGCHPPPQRSLEALDLCFGSLQSQPWRRKKRRERKPVPEAGGAGAKIRTPGRGHPAGHKPTTAAPRSGSTAWASGKLKPSWREGELSLHKRLCSGNGVQGRWGWLGAQGQEGMLPGGCKVRRRGGSGQDSC